MLGPYHPWAWALGPSLEPLLGHALRPMLGWVLGHLVGLAPPWAVGSSLVPLLGPPIWPLWGPSLPSEARHGLGAATSFVATNFTQRKQKPTHNAAYIPRVDLEFDLDFPVQLQRSCGIGERNGA